MNANKAQKQGSRAAGAFSLPSKDAFVELKENLCLSRPQAVALEEVLRDVDADLKIYRASQQKRPNRPDMLLNLNKTLRLAKALQRQIQRPGGDLLDFMPHEGLRQIAALLTFSAITDARGKDAFPKDFAADMRALEKDLGHSPNLVEIESAYASKRAEFGLTNPAELLSHFLDTLIQPMESLVEFNRHDGGGRPISAERRYLIEQLVDAMPAIIGERPTASLTGRCVNLCELVIVACGLPSEGVDKAVVAVVQKLGKRRSKYTP
jgi:hypothetical protein